MITIGLVRIGNEPVIRYTADNKPVLDLSLAYNYGRKGQDGKYPTQWVNASLWGDRAEKLLPYLHKGNQIVVHLSDVHIDTYPKKDGTQGSNLKARIADLNLVNAGEKREEQPAAQSTAQPARTFDDLPDDLPF